MKTELKADSKQCFTVSRRSFSLHTLSLRTLSLHTLSLRTLSLHTLSLRTLSLLTLSLRTLSMHILSLRTLSLHTLSLRTLSLRTHLLRTLLQRFHTHVMHVNCTKRQVDIASEVRRAVMAGDVLFPLQLSRRNLQIVLSDIDHLEKWQKFFNCVDDQVPSRKSLSIMTPQFVLYRLFKRGMLKNNASIPIGGLLFTKDETKYSHVFNAKPGKTI